MFKLKQMTLVLSIFIGLIAVNIVSGVKVINAANLDQYGGIIGVSCPKGPQPHFYTQKIGNRWWVCDPAGNGFYVRGVNIINYNIDVPEQQVVQGPKYNSVPNPYINSWDQATSTVWFYNWAINQINRLKTWGFNEISAGSHLALTPAVRDGRWSTPDATIPSQFRMPFEIGSNTTRYLMVPSVYNTACNATPLKDIMNGVGSAYTTYRYNNGDYFDPNYSNCLSNIVKNSGINQYATGIHNDYFLYITIDESDQTGGFLAEGPDFIQNLPVTPGGNVGWVTLAASPVQTSANVIGQFFTTYSDKEVYSKVRFADDMLNRYLCTGVGAPVATCTGSKTGTGSIDPASASYVGAANIATATNALNSAWGSHYTTLSTSDSHCTANLGTSGAGCLNTGSYASFGTGTGLLDENGFCPTKGSSACWMGDDFTLAGETAAMQSDIGVFVSDYAERYFSTQEAQWHNSTYGAPGVMLEMNVGAYGRPPVKEVMPAIGKYLDLPSAGALPPAPASCLSGCSYSQQMVDFFAKYLGDRPWVNFELFDANADSSEAPYNTNSTYPTQGARGVAYQQMVDGLMNNDTDSITGTHHGVGFFWWGMYDMDNEKINWGLVSRFDNAYDGKEAVIAKGTDPWGYATGGEVANYGDFISYVKTANNSIDNRFSSSTTTIDNQAPSMPSNLSASTASNQVGLSWSPSTDNVGVVGYKVMRNGIQIGASLGTSYTDTAVSPSTIYTYNVSAYDAVGNTSALSASANVTTPPIADTTKPTVSIIAPINGVTVQGTVTLQAQASDNIGVASVVFLMDGGALATDTASPYTAFLDTTKYANGSHTLNAVAVDASGNQASSAIQITVSNALISDTTAPVISSIQIVPGNTSAVITWTTNEPSTSGIDIGTTSVYSKSQTSSTLVIAHKTTVSNLTKSTTYHFRLHSKDASGNEALSQDQSFTTLGRLNRPPKPTNIQITFGSVIMKWPKLDYPYLKGYVVMKSTSTYPTAPQKGTKFAQNTYTDKDVIPGQTYYYTLWSYDDAGVYSEPTQVKVQVPNKKKVSSIDMLQIVESQLQEIQTKSNALPEANHIEAKMQLANVLQNLTDFFKGLWR